MTDLFPTAAIVLFGLFVLFSLYMMFVFVPFALWTERECLSKGYPKAEVTIALERYCLNLDGSVTTKVERLK